MIKLTILLVLVLISISLCKDYTHGLWTEEAISDYQCFYQASYKFQFINCYTKDQFTDYCISNILNAQKRDIPSDIIIHPSGSIDAYTLSQLISQRFDASILQNIYIGELELSLTIDQNCAYMEDLVYYLQLLYPGNDIRIFGAEKNTWISVFGGADLCNDFTKLKLAYWDPDNTPNFEDWSTWKYGGWSSPYDKLYTSYNVICGYSTIADAIRS